MRHVLTLTLVGALAIGSHPLAAQDTTGPRCDPSCMAALARLTPGAEVDVWAANARTRGRFVRLDTTAGRDPALLIRVDPNVRSPARTVSATDLQSVEERVSNLRRYTLYGAGAGATVGAVVALMDVVLRFVEFAWIDSNRNLIDQRRTAAALALGTFGGAFAGAAISTRVPRWERRFARPQ